MREQLYIRLDRPTPSVAQWLTWGGPDTPVSAMQSGPLAEAAPLAGGRRVVVFVPGADVLLTRASVPSRNRQRLAAAVPYALEEQLAEDVDALHFALGTQRDKAGALPVAVVSRARMDTWLDALQQAGIHTDFITPDLLAVPHSAGAWTLLLEPGAALLCTGNQRGLALEPEVLHYALPCLLEEAEGARPDVLRAILCDDVAAPGFEGIEAVPVIEPCWEGPALGFLARNFNEQVAINLLQGSYSRREQLGQLWRPWRAAASLVALWLVVQCGTNVSQYYHLKHEDEALKQEITQIYLKTFPESKRVVDARVQMQSALDKLRGGASGIGDPVALLAKVSMPLAAIPSASVRRLNFHQEQLDIALVVNDLQTLEQLKQNIGNQTKLSVEIQSAAARDNRVEAVLLIKGGA